MIIFFVGVLDETTKTVNFRSEALGLFIFVRGFRRAYKRSDLYPRGLITGMKESALKKAIAVLIKIRFAFTGF